MRTKCCNFLISVQFLSFTSIKFTFKFVPVEPDNCFDYKVKTSNKLNKIN